MPLPERIRLADEEVKIEGGARASPSGPLYPPRNPGEGLPKGQSLCPFITNQPVPAVSGPESTAQKAGPAPAFFLGAARVGRGGVTTESACAQR